MKIFFDANVYVSEALFGEGAERIMSGVAKGRWRVYVSDHVIDETGHVLTDYLSKSQRFVALTQKRIRVRAVLVQGHSKAHVPADAKDTPVLRDAVASGAHFLVTNDKHLLALNPYESLRIVTMNEFLGVLRSNGLL